jgi:ubiquitin carboxyl-terminal hydrolase 25/28
MSGLDAFANFTVDGYRSPNGDITTAKKRIWITKPPKVMTFVLQRVVYDKEKGLQKQTTPFTFQKEIFLDRFLMENKKTLKHPHDEKKSLKIREKRIDSSIQKIKEFKGSNMSVMDLLDMTNDFMQEQLGELEKDYVDVNSDSADERIDNIVDKKEMKKMIDTISAYKKRVQQQLNQLEGKKSHIKVSYYILTDLCRKRLKLRITRPSLSNTTYTA